MQITMYRASAPILLSAMNGLLVVLDKAEKFAAETKIAPETLLGARLIDDMFPASRQIQIATDNAKGIMSRLAGKVPPSWEDTETTFAELKARVQKAIDYVGSIPASEVDGSEDRPILLKTGGRELNFTGETYLTRYAIQNFMFHVTTAYAIFRSKGVPVGKVNFHGAA